MSAIDDLDIQWIPSHGKHLDWAPPEPYDAAHWRLLNERADLGATSAASLAWQQSAPERDQLRRTSALTRRALLAQLGVLEDWRRMAEDEGWWPSSARKGFLRA